MNRWILPSNPKKYDVIGAFKETSYIEWVQRLKSVEVGDIAYIYITRPVGAIKFACEVTAINLTPDDLIVEHKGNYYREVGYADDGLCMRLRKLYEFDDTTLPMHILEQHGVTGPIQNARSAPGELVRYIDSLGIKVIGKFEPLSRILFCNIAWMESYDISCFPDDIPRNGGSYVADTSSAYESLNFHRYDEGYFGFVETKYRGESANQLHIERIDSQATDDAVGNVLVVFCAYSDELNNTVVVGWYKNATVLRYRKEHPDGHVYNIISTDGVLLPAVLRTKIFPRARNGLFGFGQSNVKYASGEGADEVVKDILIYINSFESDETLTQVSERVMAELPDEKLAMLADGIPAAPAPVFTSMTIQRKRNPYLPEQVKRRADGVCELCGKQLDYHDYAGRPYLEAHHIIPLAEDGIDDLSNMVALCPNCHKRMHIVKDPKDIKRLVEIASK